MSFNHQFEDYITVTLLRKFGLEQLKTAQIFLKVTSEQHYAFYHILFHRFRVAKSTLEVKFFFAKTYQVF